VSDAKHLIATYLNLGVALSDAGESAKALETARALFEQHGAQLFKGSPALWHEMRAKIPKGLAQCYMVTDPKRAQAVLEEALSGVDLEQADAAEADLFQALGSILYTSGDLLGAKQILEPALKRLEHHVGSDSPLLGDPLLVLGMTYRQLNLSAAARPVLERALSLAERMVGPNHTNTLLAARTLAEVLVDMNEIATAHALLKKTVQHIDVSEAMDLSALVELLCVYGITSNLLGNPAYARECWTRALELARNHNLREPQGPLIQMLRQLDSQAPDQR
jgi:tetratricopeptide (TPR) repeat protein